MSKELQKKIGVFGRYAILIIVGFVMIYPLIWMVGASFKTNDELFSSIGVIPRNPTVSGYVSGFKGYFGMSIWHFFINTYKIVIPKVIVTVLSATLTAYAFNLVFTTGRSKCTTVRSVRSARMAGFLSAADYSIIICM